MQDQSFEQEPSSVATPGPSMNKQYEEVLLHNKKIYNCLIPGCGKTFKFKSEMKRHLTIHSNERPYTCSFPDCGKTFKRADALSNHFRIHSRSTPFNCPVPECMSQFTTKSALRYHLLKHTGEKIFKCNYPGCSKAFITYAQLKQHEKASYYHQKVADTTPEDENEFQMNHSVSSFDELQFDENEDLPDFENPNPIQAKFDGFDKKFEEIMHHQKGSFTEKLQAFRNWDSLGGAFEDKVVTPSPQSSDLSTVSKSEKKVESTLMKMLDFMMKENQQLKKKLKYTSDLLQNNSIEKIQPNNQLGNVDLFFKSIDQDEEWGERNFGPF